MLGVVDSYPGITPEEFSTRADLPEVLAPPAINKAFSLPRSDYQVRLAQEHSLLYARANNLVKSMYSSRGLETPGPLPSMLLPDPRRETRSTLAASRDDDVLGTLTLEIDPGAELQADALYRTELDALRSQGKRLCEVTRLALHPTLSSREVMATLFHITFLLANRVHKCTDMLAEVHPRHALFYQRTLGYKVVGQEKICQRVGAPAVLMHLCLDFAQKQISQLAGSGNHGHRNLYNLFMPEPEQDAFLQQLFAVNAEI